MRHINQRQNHIHTPDEFSDNLKERIKIQMQKEKAKMEVSMGSFQLVAMETINPEHKVEAFE